jgi:uncharacterized protein YbjT (DUF2867 family)
MMNTKTNSQSSLKFVVIGGTGLIGKPVVARLRDLGHAVVVASPSQGINTVTGEGLAAAFAGAHTVIDVSNSPSFEDAAVLDFFTRSTRNLLAAARTAGVRHVVALSVVGTERMTASGYFRAKLEQESQIKASPLPYTILRATQFFEFAGGIAYVATAGTTVRLAPALMQPIAATDVSAAVVKVALAAPRNGTVEVAGPASIPQDAFVRRFLETTRDPRTVITDPAAPYFGNIPVNDQTLRPGANPLLGTTAYETWLAAYAEKARLAGTSAAV